MLDEKYRYDIRDFKGKTSADLVRVALDAERNNEPSLRYWLLALERDPASTDAREGYSRAGGANPQLVNDADVGGPALAATVPYNGRLERITFGLQLMNDGTSMHPASWFNPLRNGAVLTPLRLEIALANALFDLRTSRVFRAVVGAYRRSFRRLEQFEPVHGLFQYQTQYRMDARATFNEMTLEGTEVEQQVYVPFSSEYVEPDGREPTLRRGISLLKRKIVLAPEQPARKLGSSRPLLADTQLLLEAIAGTSNVAPALQYFSSREDNAKRTLSEVNLVVPSEIGRDLHYSTLGQSDNSEYRINCAGGVSGRRARFCKRTPLDQ